MSDLILYDHKSSICSQMARLALAEKGVSYQRRQVDIMETNEQFEPWYVALNPKAVVPTLQIGNEVVTDTIKIVNRVQLMDGPDLGGDESTQAWLADIMSLHYGVLLYRNRVEKDGTAPQIVARGRLLRDMIESRPKLAQLLEVRLSGNRRMQALLKNPADIEKHLSATHQLIKRMIAAVDANAFIAGPQYSLADCFATAAMARFKIHQLEPWWRQTPLEAYYGRMRSRPSFTEAEVIETGTERDL